MDKLKTLQILETLANGIDPISGEVFPEHSPYQNVTIVRSLYHAVALLKETPPKQARHLPPRGGKPWDKEEDDALKLAFINASKLSDLAKKHERSNGAIRSRLQRLGLIDAEGNKILQTVSG